jgi:hypothetical protein
VSPVRPALLALVLLLATLATLALPGAASAQGWTLVTQQDGVTVMKREAPGRDFPTFRAIGMVDANLFQVMAVLSDVPRHTEWVSSCTDARVLHSTVHVGRGMQVVDVRFRATWNDKMPPMKGVVRMTNLRGHYRMKALGPDKMLMDYEVDADPAGSLPRWLAKLATKKLPLETIRALRRQAKKTQGWYTERIRRWQAMEKTLPVSARP